MKHHFSEKTLEKAKKNITKIRSNLDKFITLIGTNVHSVLSHKKKMKDIHSPIDSKEVEQDFDFALNNGDAQILVTDEKFHTYVLQNAGNYKSLLIELGRKREEAFRGAGEGTGKPVDLDKYDAWYHHIILWDHVNQGIAGAYRIGIGSKIVTESAARNLYSASLFNFPSAFSKNYLSNGLELGRSFVSDEYRKGCETLDRLWKGISLFIEKCQKDQPELRYLFGPVSMSERVSEREKALLVSFCNQYLNGKQLNDPIFDEVRGKNPFKIPKKSKSEVNSFFEELEKIPENKRFKKGFAALISEFKKTNSPFPILFFSYSEICERSSFRYIAFNRDKKFASVDGLLLLDMQGITPSAQTKYGIKCVSNQM